MTDHVAQLLARVGKTRDDINKQSRLGSLFRRGGVANTPELKRITELHAYRWQDDGELSDVAKYLESLLALPPRQGCKRACGHQPREKDCSECIRAAAACVCRGDGFMELRQTQAAALQAIHDFGGMLGPIRVGGGKTIISYLAGAVLDTDRVLLVIPAKLRKKTLRDFNQLKRHWKAPKRLHLITYELLSRDRGLAELEAYRPTLVVADEAHKFKNPRAVCTRRLNRHLNKDNPECGYVDMSGTITKRSILEYYHRQNWAIPDGLQPLPRKWNEVKDWADAIDEKVGQGGRLMPGALLQLFSDDELGAAASNQNKTNTLKLTRQAYGRRLMSAPAVVGTEDQFDGAMGLQIQGHEFEPGEEVLQAFQGLRDEWLLPDGHPIDMPATLWMHARSLVQGFYRRWDPLPPPEWLMARKVWAATVREVLKSYHDIDSPLGVTREVDKGRIGWAAEALQGWREIKDTFTPNSVPVWIDDTCLQWVAGWATKNRGIIWVHEVPFGERLSKETGIPYYGQQGMCGTKMIEDETRTCIASIGANSEGRNLQQYNQNLVVSTPPGGAVWEQMLGRTHRDGQDADEVLADVLLCCFEQWDVFRRAMRDAEYIERTTAQSQKLNFADVTVEEERVIQLRHASGDPLWNKRNAEFFEGVEEYTEGEHRFADMSPAQRANLRRGIA